MSGGKFVTDKITGVRSCVAMAYTYDDGINPFKNLGYTDYLLTNLSAKNKLSENTNYINCAFPSFIPGLMRMNMTTGVINFNYNVL
jgi:hypothetical protein